jgi:hypothetical protein
MGRLRHPGPGSGFAVAIRNRFQLWDGIVEPVFKRLYQAALRVVLLDRLGCRPVAKLTIDQAIIDREQS